VKKPHKNLNAWSEAVDLVTTVYLVTKSFPKDARFSITDQLRRAALSVPSDIAEGAARNTRKEFINFLHMAQGSLSELDTQLEVAKRLSYLSKDDWDMLDTRLPRIDKMISGLIAHQKRAPQSLISDPKLLTPHP
jgi:four helix bundle protein